MPWRIALLLAGSGFCALAYQSVWFRLFRLVFGASTAANAAVMAVFMGGLGVGSVLLGPYADRSERPLRLYALLELGIAVAAALSLALVPAVRGIYLGLGGTEALGQVGGTAVRLALSAIVIGPPAVLMGGTLPAAVRAAGTLDGRRGIGLLYGTNTCGAVLGVLWTTFVALEILGHAQTLLAGALLNLVVAVIALRMAKGLGVPVDATPEAARGPLAPTYGVLVAAALVGMVFMLMELVWYRMLTPLLGGSSYTFGLILALALLGIGVGGALYGARGRPSVAAFALSCAAEALFMALPFAAGDGLAALAVVAGEVRGLGFPHLVGAWTAISCVLVLPPAIVAGYQFPLLVALLGRGDEDAGRQVGLAYAWNTGGAILGSLAGGFGLMPALGAVGAWKVCVGSLVVLSVAAASWGTRSDRRSLWAVPVALTAGALLSALGPTGFWRHNPIGVGRVSSEMLDTREIYEDEVRAVRRAVHWEADGVESAIAAMVDNGVSLVVNGKSDGNAIGDAPTQVMGGLVGALLHGEVEDALVVGLGTGSTAGWLAEVESIDRVVAYELEPAVLEVAKLCEAVNAGGGEHPQVELVLGDAREHLLANKEGWDLVFSEPSNPYRAGVASLFTVEFYEAVAARLNEGGVFLQWVQAYEVDVATIVTVVSTMQEVFGAVEVWEVHTAGDLLLVASVEPLDHDVARTAALAQQEPYRTALERVWGVSGAEGLYSGFIANDAWVRALVKKAAVPLNTDDRPVVEFAFARQAGRAAGRPAQDLRDLAQELGGNRPATRGELDWGLVQNLLSVRRLRDGVSPAVVGRGGEDDHTRAKARQAFLDEDFDLALELWSSQPAAPSQPADLWMVAESLALAGAEELGPVLAELAQQQPGTAIAVAAAAAHVAGEPAAAEEAILRALAALRSDPWIPSPLARRTLRRARSLLEDHPDAAPRVAAAIAEPFAAWRLERQRRAFLAELALGELGPAGLACSEAFAADEPDVSWDEWTLDKRVTCYEELGHPLLEQARADLAELRSWQPSTVTGLLMR